MIRNWCFVGLLICVFIFSCNSYNESKVKADFDTICVPNIDSINSKYFEDFGNYKIINDTDLVDLILKDSVISFSQLAVKLNSGNSKVILPVSIVRKQIGIPLSADYQVNVFSGIDSASFRTCSLDTFVSISSIENLKHEIACSADENNELFYSISLHQPLKKSQLSFFLSNIGSMYSKNLDFRVLNSELDLCGETSMNELNEIFKPNYLRINLKGSQLPKDL